MLASRLGTYNTDDSVNAQFVGNVWIDANLNMTKDPNQAAASRVQVDLIDSAGKVVATAVTDPLGNYSFPAPLGRQQKYTVEIVLQPDMP